MATTDPSSTVSSDRTRSPHDADSAARPGSLWIQHHGSPIVPARGGSATNADGDWPAYDPLTGVRTAAVLGGLMLLVLLYILHKTRGAGRAGGTRRRWTSKDRLFIEKYKRKVCRRSFDQRQGHHHRHNGDQAARRPHILCSICVHSFGALRKVYCSWHHFTASPCVLSFAFLTVSPTSNRLAAI